MAKERWCKKQSNSQERKLSITRKQVPDSRLHFPEAVSAANSSAKVGASAWGTRLQAVKQPEARAPLDVGLLLLCSISLVYQSLKSLKESRTLLRVPVALGGLICYRYSVGLPNSAMT